MAANRAAQIEHRRMLQQTTLRQNQPPHPQPPQSYRRPFQNGVMPQNPQQQMEIGRAHV